MASETLGASFSIDVTDLKAGLAQANRLIKESESEFRAAAAGMDDWTKSEDGLNARIKTLNATTEIQRQKVDALQGEYDRLIADGLDPTSKQAVELRTKINKETEALNKNEAELKNQTQALEDLGNATDEAGDSVEDMGGKFDGLKAAGGVAVGAIAAVGAACVAAVGAFFGLAESTREARNNMAKVETAFQTAGLSAQNAADTMTTLYGIMGDEGAAGEAAQQLAKISQSESDLEANTRILTGVMAEYGASIPLEGLAEGMAATAAMGEVQGPLADALEWQGVNLEDVNAKLATLSTEEERAAYIQEQLTGLYGESADAYRENNAAIIASQEAQARLNDSLNQLGAIAEPILTTIKTLAADLLTSIMPFVSLIGEGLTGALNGSAGAAETFATGLTGIVTTLTTTITNMLPKILDAIIAVVPQLLTALLAQLPKILSTLTDMLGKVIKALSAMLPDIVAAIMKVLPQLINSLIAAIPTLLEAAVSLLLAIVDAVPIIITELIAALPSIIDTIITAVTESIPILLDASTKLMMTMIEAIPVVIDALVANLPQIISAIVSGLITAVPQIVAGSVQMYMGLVTAIPQIIKTLVSKIPSIITAIVSGLKDGISKIKTVGVDMVKGLWNGISDTSKWIIQKIKGFGSNILKSMKDFFEIRSPAKRPAREISKPFMQGLAKGFEDNEQLVLSAVEEISEDILKTELFYLEEKERIEKEKAEAELNERIANAKDAEEIEKIKQEGIQKAAENAQNEYLEGLKVAAELERAEYEKRLQDTEKAYDKFVELEEKAYSEISQAGQKAYEDILKAREAVTSNLYEDMNDTFKTIRFIDGDKTEEFYTLPDMKAQNADLTKYNTLLDELIAKYGTLPSEVIENLEAMTTEDGIKYVTAMLNASEEKWNEYVESFGERQNIAEKIGKALFPDEALENIKITTANLTQELFGKLQTKFDEFFLNFTGDIGLLNEIAKDLAETTAKAAENSGLTVNQTNIFKQAYSSRIEQYKSKQQLTATVRLATAKTKTAG